MASETSEKAKMAKMASMKTAISQRAKSAAAAAGGEDNGEIWRKRQACEISGNQAAANISSGINGGVANQRHRKSEKNDGNNEHQRIGGVKNVACGVSKKKKKIMKARSGSGIIEMAAKRKRIMASRRMAKIIKSAEKWRRRIRHQKASMRQRQRHQRRMVSANEINGSNGSIALMWRRINKRDSIVA